MRHLLQLDNDFAHLASRRWAYGRVVCACLLITLVRASPLRAQPAQQQREALIDSLLQRMTVQEKLGQLAQYSGQWATTGPEATVDQEALITKGAVGSFLNIYGAEETRRLQRMAVEESRLGIPLLFAYDVIHGFRTTFPMPLAMASSFDPEAVEQAARVAAVEATASGLHWTFAPMVDVARDPRWGRIMEGAGEDPYLNSVMARAEIRGFQGRDLASPRTVLATAKHYVAYGGVEAGRDYNTVDLSERRLRETYLPPFHAAVRAGVGSIMTAFNELNGIPMHANGDLVNGVLRDEWGWRGLVVSDYGGIRELIPHGIAATRTEAGMKALRAGVDIDMMSGIYGKELPSLVQNGSLSERVVDRAVRRVLRAKYDLGLFENPYRYSDAEREADEILTAEHRQTARTVARESMVLLKNEGDLLPLSKNTGTIAVVGTLAVDRRTPLGEWAGVGRAEDTVTLLEGIREAVGPHAKVRYVKGADVQGADSSGFAEAVRLAEDADVVVLALGENYNMSGEAASRASLGLPGVQQQFARAIYATGTPTVAVLMNGRPLAVDWLDRHVPTILEAWYPGLETGHAVSDVLFGDYNPSGKLPVTFPRTVGQVPLYYNHKNTGRPPADHDYTSRYLNTPWTPLYPFGHGLSYTSFEYGAPQLSDTTMPADGQLTVQVDVTNTGKRDGHEVVQLYVRDLTAGVTRPVKELRGFQRIRLHVGQTQTVSFTLAPKDLSFYNQEMRCVVEPGWFRVFIGGSSATTNVATFRVVGNEHQVHP